MTAEIREGHALTRREVARQIGSAHGFQRRHAVPGGQGGERAAEVYDPERRLLHVACTRARDELLVIGVEPASEFLDDLKV